MLVTVSRGIDSRREVPPPIRHSISVSERLPLSLVLAPGSLEPLGRWSVPITSTVSVPVIMFEPEVSAFWADCGIPSPVPELTRNRTSDSSSQATTAMARPASARFQVIRLYQGPAGSRPRLAVATAVTATAAAPALGLHRLVVLAAQA